MWNVLSMAVDSVHNFSVEQVLGTQPLFIRTTCPSAQGTTCVSGPANCTCWGFLLSLRRSILCVKSQWQPPVGCMQWLTDKTINLSPWAGRWSRERRWSGVLVELSVQVLLSYKKTLQLESRCALSACFFVLPLFITLVVAARLAYALALFRTERDWFIDRRVQEQEDIDEIRTIERIL